MSTPVHQKLRDASTLAAWEPIDGYAVLTCKIRVRSGACDTWEPRTYAFTRTASGWSIDTNPGYLNRQSWDDVVGWLCHMRPLEIDLLTTV